MFAQTGILLFAIVYSPYFWLKLNEDWQNIRKQVEIRDFFQGEVNRMDSDLKIENIKNSYKNINIGIKEDFNE